MAEIKFQCPECQQHLAIDACQAGLKATCPTCSRTITVPPSSVQASPQRPNPHEVQPVLARPVSKPMLKVLKLVVLAAAVVAGIYGMVVGLHYYHRSRSTILFSDGCDKYNKGDYDGALADFNQVIQYRPDFVDAYNGRGLVKYAKSDYDGALADLNRVVELRPNFPEVYCNRGNVNYCKTDLAAAFADYNRAIEANPADYIAFVNRGNIANRKGDYDGALGDYDILVHFSETEYGRANYSVDRSGEDTFQIGQDELLAMVQEAIDAGGGLTEVVDQIGTQIDDDAWNECDPDMDSYGDYEYEDHDSNDSGNGEVTYSQDQIRNKVMAFLRANHPELAQQL
jgi:tetratricopeptide (TPR) repeat protein